jgi:hypothetical protein
MPAVSDKQKKFMRAVAENPKFAKKVGVPQSVGREFSKSGGGEMKESKTMMKKEVAFMKKKGAPKSMVKHEMAEAGMKKGGMAKKYAMGGMSKSEMPSKMGKVATAKPKMGSASKRADGVAVKGKTRGMEVKMAKGGMSRKGC